MAAVSQFSREDRIGLGVAVVSHIALVAAFFAQASTRTPLPTPERMTVSLASDVGLVSTAPDPSPEPAAAIAPELAPEPAPPVVEPQQQPQPRPTATPAPAPRPTPAPAARQTPAPRPSPAASPRPTPTATPRPTPSPTATAGGGSRLGSNFLDGASDASGTQGQAAATVGPAVQASLGQAIIRQLRPHWNPPSGVDVDQLVTVVRFRLNRDGSLSGNPEVLRTTGQTDNNRTQVNRHQEQAIRAVRLAAPFNLPEEYYAGWRVVTSNFDNRLLQ